MKRFKVTVTRDNIDFGTPTVGNSCPIALNLRDSLNLSQDDVWVDEKKINIHGMEFKTPRAAARFITNFDNEKSVKPFSFYLS